MTAGLSCPEPVAKVVTPPGTEKVRTLSSLALSDVLRRNVDKLYRVSLDRLDCSFGVMTKSGNVPLRQIVVRRARAQKADVVLLLAVRRPGCGNCREHGEQLSHLAAHDPRLALMGVIKDAVDDNANVLEFHGNHFAHPLYLDEKWNVYKAMGKRTLTMETLKAGVKRLMPRYKSKGIPMRFDGGDRFVMGGILIFDKRGNLRYAYEEAYGEELDMALIQEAIRELRTDHGASMRSLSVSSEEEQRFL